MRHGGCRQRLGRDPDRPDRRRRRLRFAPRPLAYAYALRRRAAAAHVEFLEGPKMQLTPREKDKLLIAMAALVARRRLERGVRLNYPETIALISDFVMEGARDGRS